MEALARYHTGRLQKSWCNMFQSARAARRTGMVVSHGRSRMMRWPVFFTTPSEHLGQSVARGVNVFPGRYRCGAGHRSDSATQYGGPVGKAARTQRLGRPRVEQACLQAGPSSRRISNAIADGLITWPSPLSPRSVRSDNRLSAVGGLRPQRNSNWVRFALSKAIGAMPVPPFEKAELACFSRKASERSPAFTKRTHSVRLYTARTR
jgi:hypothetical protein